MTEVVSDDADKIKRELSDALGIMHGSRSVEVMLGIVRKHRRYLLKVESMLADGSLVSTMTRQDPTSMPGPGERRR